MALKTQPTSIENVAIIENSTTSFCDCFFRTGLSLLNVTKGPENKEVRKSKYFDGSMVVKNVL